MVKTYKPMALDILAQNVLKQFNEELIRGEPCEIPIEEIVEFHFGLIVQYRNLSKNGIIHGITVFQDSIVPIYDDCMKRYEAIFAKEGTIIVDKRLLAENRIKRLRFTFAHELGHFMIHQEHYREIDQLASKTSSDSNAKTEREADYLGAALLMPYGRVKVAFLRLSTTFSKEGIIKKLAQIFNVSVQAMEIRLKIIGLI